MPTQRLQRETIGCTATLDFQTVGDARKEGENQTGDAEYQERKRKRIDGKTTDFTEKFTTVQSPDGTHGEASGRPFGRSAKFVANEVTIRRDGDING